MSASQDGRFLAIDTPLGKDVLLMAGMTAAESLGRLFEFEIDLVSEYTSINIPDVLGKNVTVTLNMGDGGDRYFNGIVSDFSQTGSIGRFTSYHASVKPWLWFLTRTADCRIFQEMTVPDIIKQILQEHGYSGEIDDRMTGSYRSWVYCVQYRESDFNFLSRLMEQEGIYYYFVHDNGSHKLVLSDSYSGHEAVPNYTEIPFYVDSEGAGRERDHISEWRVTQQLQPTNYVLTDYDFERPNSDLETRAQVSRDHDQVGFEVFDYPGEYSQTSDGDAYVSARIEELQAGYERCEGAGNAKGISTGALFKLTGFERADQDREYLVRDTTLSMHSDQYETGPNSAENVFHCSFTAIDSKTPYRSPRRTPKPIVQGPHTAVIVGPAGEEIWCDKYGRVKAQFHWDRLGKNDENSSCWMRVSQLLTGKNWGSIDIPRVGQEVIVSFLEGDPDKPIITGRVYNADNMPPFELPGKGMVSGMKSNTTPGGGGFNEISMDDSKGNEAMTLHAQYNMGSTVQNDQTITVVSGNRTLTVESGTLTETIKGDASLTIQAGSRTVDVTSGNYSATASAAVHLHGKSEGVTVTGDVLGVGVTGNGQGVGITGNDEGVNITGNAKGVGIIGNGQGVGITGNDAGVGITGNDAGVNIIGNTTGVGITGNGLGVGITGNDEGVSITGNAKGVGITGNGEGVSITGNTLGVVVTGKGQGVTVDGTPNVNLFGTEKVVLNTPHVDIDGTSKVEIDGPEVNICGDKVVLSAGGGSITIDATGVTIEGVLVKIN